MADKYAVAKSRLDGLVTSIQELSGATTGLTPEQMQEQLDIANAEIEEQAAIIAEISDILATKAGGAGGTTLDTCTVTLTDEPFSYIDYMSPTGRFCGEIDSSVTKIDVVKGSLLYGSYPENTLLALTGGVSEIMSRNFNQYVLVINGDGDIACSG